MAEGYAERVSHSQGYILGPATFCLSRYGKYNNKFISLCHPIMNYIHKKTGHAVVLAVIQVGLILYHCNHRQKTS